MAEMRPNYGADGNRSGPRHLAGAPLAVAAIVGGVFLAMVFARAFFADAVVGA